MKATSVAVSGTALAVFAFGFMSLTTGWRTGDGEATIHVEWTTGPAEVSWSLNTARHHEAYPARGIGDWFQKTVKVQPGDVIRVDGKLTGDQKPGSTDYEMDCKITYKGVRHVDEGDGTCHLTLTIADL